MVKLVIVHWQKRNSRQKLWFPFGALYYMKMVRTL
jgi:hypothetical protein